MRYFCSEGSASKIVDIMETSICEYLVCPRSELCSRGQHDRFGDDELYVDAEMQEQELIESGALWTDTLKRLHSNR